MNSKLTFFESKVAYLDYLLVPSLQVVRNVNIETGKLLFHYWPLVNQESASIVGMVNTNWHTTVFEHMVKILNPL